MMFINFCIILLIVGLLSLTAVSAIDKNNAEQIEYNSMLDDSNHVKDKTFKFEGKVVDIKQENGKYDKILVFMNGDSTKPVFIMFEGDASKFKVDDEIICYSEHFRKGTYVSSSDVVYNDILCSVSKDIDNT